MRKDAQVPAGPVRRDAVEASGAGAEVAVDASGHTAEAACLNCGTVLTGKYCHECGQHGHVHRSLLAFGHDLLHGVFHFEGKVWRTLLMLVRRPGELTRRYIDGERASFVSPVALFLFTIFLMFAAVGWSGILDVKAGENIRLGIENSAREQQQRVAQLEVERADAVRRGVPTAEIDRRLRGARDDLEVTRAFIERGEIRNREDPAAGATVAPWLRGPIEKVAKNPDLLIYKLKTNAYKFSWMIIPLSVPFMWLLFPFSRRFRLYDHMVFVTYSLCFMTLLGVAALLLMAGGLSGVAGLLFFVPPIHWYAQLKGAYRLGRLGALWRTLVLILFTSVTLTIFVTILVGLGVFE